MKFLLLVISKSCLWRFDLHYCRNWLLTSTAFTCLLDLLWDVGGAGAGPLELHVPYMGGF